LTGIVKKGKRRHFIKNIKNILNSKVSKANSSGFDSPWTRFSLFPSTWCH